MGSTTRNARKSMLTRLIFPDRDDPELGLVPNPGISILSCTVGTMATGPASKAARYELDMHPVETRK